MSNKLKRSDKYNFFKGTVNNQKQKKTPKENFKFIFKIIKIVFYVFLLGLSLTGCIQSVAIRSSSTTGSGIEFYKGKNDVAPFVSTYKIITTKMKDKDGNVIFGSDGETPKYVQKLIKDTKVNYLVNNVDNTITNLKKQIDENSFPNSELYGQYDNYSSSLRIVNSKNELILDTFNINLLNPNEKEQLIKGTGSKKETLFLNSTMLNEMNKSTSYSYDSVNKLITIPVFIQKRPEEPTDINDKKIWENAIPGGKFQAFLDNSDPTTPPVKINDKGQYIRNDNSVYSPEEVNKFVYSFEFDKVELTIDLSNMFASEKFARDYLQSLINVVMQFNQLDDLDKLPNPNQTIITEPISISPTERRLNNLNSLISGKFINPLVEPKQQEKNSIYINDIKETNQKYTTEMKNAILNYQANIIEILGLTGYSIPKLNFSSEEPDDWTSKFSLKFGTNNNNYNLLSNGSSISQKPIVNWNDAWGLGPFYGFVVYPIYLFVELLVGSLPSSLGGGVALLSIAISVIAARMLTLLLTYKSVFAQAKQQTLAPKKAKIDAKYAAYKGNKQMEQRKRQETSELYKKNNINMLTPLLSTLISMPIFLSMWRIIQGIPFIKSTSLWGINFSQTSWRELFAGEWQYLILIILAVVVQAGSQFLPRYLSKKRMKERSNIAEKEAMKKANRTQNIMMAIFVFMAVIFEAGVQIYWIVGGIWTMLQTLLIHHIQKTKIFREKLIKYV